VAWNLAGSAGDALLLQRLSAPGWLPLAPLSLNVVRNALDEPPAWLDRALRVLYLEAVLALGVAWGTPWAIEGTVRTTWGWSPVAGPALLFQYFVIAVCVSVSLGLWSRLSLRSPEGGTRRGLVTAAFLTPLLVTSTTDILLPLAGHHEIPRFGTLSLAFLGVLHIVSFYRYGDSALVPEGLTARIVEHLPDGIAVLGLTGHVRAANARLAELLGMDRDELVGTWLPEWLSTPSLLSPPREIRELECEMRPRSGPPIAVAVSTAVQTDNLGVPRSVSLIVRDLREVVSLRNRLITSGRMAAVGELAAGIAHEINNPITYVRANLSVLREHWRSVSKALGEREDWEERIAEGEELIDESLEGVDRACGIIRDVREFSHAGAGERESADLNRLLEQTLRVVGPQIPTGARVETRLGELPLVECEPQRLKQVFANLVLNAAQAIGPAGGIVVETRAAGGEVTVAVVDDGPGIPPERIGRIFDPFYTTKPVGVGTGLGLAIAFGIVRQHAGRLEVDSEPGRGAAFRVRLPVHPPERGVHDGTERSGASGPAADPGDAGGVGSDDAGLR
jgi:two-component system NtrC family sensor kinase